MAKAVYSGTFDPITMGHMDIIKRAASIFDEVTVAILNNPDKTPLFLLEYRVKMVKEAVKDLPNVKVDSFSGLLIDYAKQKDIHVSVRGLRAVTDFEYELQMAQTNRILNHKVDTFFLTAGLEYAYLSSSTVKEVAKFGGDLSAFVTPSVAEQVMKKINS